MAEGIKEKPTVLLGKTYNSKSKSESRWILQQPAVAKGRSQYHYSGEVLGSKS